MPDGPQSDNNYGPRLRYAIVILVMFVWSVSFLADIALASYRPSWMIHAMALFVVGVVLGRRPPKGDRP